MDGLLGAADCPVIFSETCPPVVAVVGEPRLVCESVAVVLSAASVEATAVSLDATDQPALRPTVAVVVARRPDSIDVLVDLVDRRWPGLTVLVASWPAPRTVASGSSVRGALELGAPVDALVSSVRRALAGRPTSTPARRRGFVVRHPQQSELLTPREREVLRLLSLGSSAERIAAELNIASNTVRTHVAHIRSKLGVHTRLQAVLRGVAQTTPARSA